MTRNTDIDVMKEGKLTHCQRNRKLGECLCLLCWRSTVTRHLIDESISWGFQSQRMMVHDHQAGEHSNRQAGMAWGTRTLSESTIWSTIIKREWGGTVGGSRKKEGENANWAAMGFVSVKAHAHLLQQGHTSILPPTVMKGWLGGRFSFKPPHAAPTESSMEFSQNARSRSNPSSGYTTTKGLCINTEVPTYPCSLLF